MKGFWRKFGDHIIVFLTVLLAIGSAFYVGRMSALEGQELPIQIRTSVGDIVDFSENSNTSTLETQNVASLHNENGEKPIFGMYCASKNSKIYHFWDCPSVDRIKDDNKIWFDLEEEAIESGRTMASDCRIPHP